MAEPLRYSIFDPSGNITALVESPCALERQPRVAARIMERHAEVEQVGFVRLFPAKDDIQAELRMAGGEFCGNASMCAAALFAQRSDAGACEQDVVLRVSGAEKPVHVHLAQRADGSFDAAADMPRAQKLERVELAFGTLRASVPVVHLSGISHAIIEEGSPFFALLDKRSAAEQAVRSWCHELGCDGLGLMFVADGQGQGQRELTPLVYVPGSNTVFWEGSCASGSSAAGLFFSAELGEPADLVFRQPSGTLRVASDAAGDCTRLYGGVRLLQAGLALV